MHLLVTSLHQLSLGALGLFAGAMLTEACVLVPAWRSAAPTDFHAWYAANARRLLRFFTPLTIAATLLPSGWALAALTIGHAHLGFAMASSGLMLAVVGVFYLFFQRANARFSAADLSSDDLAPALLRWATWHAGRTLLSFAALAAAISA